MTDAPTPLTIASDRDLLDEMVRRRKASGHTGSFAHVIAFCRPSGRNEMIFHVDAWGPASDLNTLVERVVDAVDHGRGQIDRAGPPSAATTAPDGVDAGTASDADIIAELERRAKASDRTGLIIASSGPAEGQREGTAHHVDAVAADMDILDDLIGRIIASIASAKPH